MLIMPLKWQRRRRLCSIIMEKFFVSKKGAGYYVFPIVFALLIAIAHPFFNFFYWTYALLLVIFFIIFVYELYRSSRYISEILLDTDNVKLITYSNFMFKSSEELIDKNNLEIIYDSLALDDNTGLIIRDINRKNNFYIPKKSTIEEDNIQKVSVEALVNKLKGN